MNDTIQHHGVKGMHWGVRKDRKSGKTRKRVKDMTDQELRDANNRMNLEKNYRQLKHPVATRVGSQFVKGVTGGLTAGAVVWSTQAIKKYGYKKFTAAVLAATIYQNAK